MRNSIAKGIAAILVAGVLAAGVCCTGFASRGDDGKWFGNGNLSTWHWNDKTDDKKPDDKPSVGGVEDMGGAVISDSENNGIALLSALLPCAAYAANGIDAQADTAYVLTATVEPDTVTDKSVDWSVSWENAGSAWANGKTVTDYVTITPTSDGALTANVVCKQAFGEKVVITVMCRYDESLTATCTVDYARRIEHVEVSTNYIFGDRFSSKSTDFAYVGSDIIANEISYFLGYVYMTDIYTLDQTYSLSIKFRSAFFDGQSLTYKFTASGETNTDGSLKYTAESLSREGSGNGLIGSGKYALISFAGETGNGISNAMRASAYNSFLQYARSQNKPALIIDYSASSRYCEYSTHTEVAVPSSWTEMATNIKTSENNIVF